MERHLKDWFSQGIKAGKLLICKDVKDEVLGGNGKKGKGAPGYHFLKGLDGKYGLIQPKDDTMSNLADVGKFVRKNYTDQYASDFLKQGKADPILVALGRSYGYTLVTQERHNIPVLPPNHSHVQGPVRLPYVALAFKVRCISLMATLVKNPSW